MKMNLAIRKYNFIQELNNIDEIILEKLELFLKTNKKDWFLDLSEGEIKEIEIGLQQASNNELVGHKSVMDKFAKWH